MLLHSTPLRAAQTAARPAARSALCVRAMASGSGSDGQVRRGLLLWLSVATGVWSSVTHSDLPLVTREAVAVQSCRTVQQQQIRAMVISTISLLPTKQWSKQWYMLSTTEKMPTNQ
jgi:hypothetical protein